MPPAFRRAGGSRPSAAFTSTTSRSCACRHARSSTRRCRTTPSTSRTRFSGPSTTNSLGKAFFEAANPPVTVGDNGSIAGGFGDSPTGRATLALRQTLLNPEQRRRGTIDAIAYGLGLGVTAHLDQGAFQKTDTPADGAAHEDNYTMQLPFLELHRKGLLNARVQINFLHMETDPAPARSSSSGS